MSDDHAALMDRLLDDVVDATRFGSSVLVQAAAQGHHDVLRHILQRVNALSACCTDTDLAQAFVAAAEQGHTSCLSVLLESGTSTSLDGPNDLVMAQREEDESTALIAAASNGHTQCVRLLLQPQQATEDGNTARVDGTADRHSSQLVQHNSAGDTALIAAARHGHAACVDCLLQHIPEVQLTTANSSEQTALMAAASNGHAECVSRLLKHSPRVHVAAADHHGTTALLFAAGEGHAECVRRLLQHSPQAQVAATDCIGNTALILAAGRGHAECISPLLLHSPQTQLSATGYDRQTALMYAARNGHAQCVALLLGYNLEQQRLDKALLSAVRQWDADLTQPSSHTRCLELLLAKGAQVPEGATAADRAALRLINGDLVSRALVADRANEAVVGLALAVSKKRSKKRRIEAE